MKYDFDHVINRKLGKCRKWDNTILKEKFGLNEDAIPMDLADLDFEMCIRDRHYVNRFEIDEVDKVTKKVVSTFSRSISDSAQAVISPSEKTKETLLKYGVKTPIYVIPTGLNFEKFHPDNIDPARVQEIRRQYGIQEDERLIVFVGRIAQEKSIEIPIEGFRYVSDTKIKLMIVGGGPQLEELQKLVPVSYTHLYVCGFQNPVHLMKKNHLLFSSMYILFSYVS